MWVQLDTSKIAHYLQNLPRENITACGIVVFDSTHAWPDGPPPGSLVVRCIECLDLAELDVPKDELPDAD